MAYDYTVGRDFVRLPTAVFQSKLAFSHPDTCDSPHITNLISDAVPIAAMHADASFKALLKA